MIIINVKNVIKSYKKKVMIEVKKLRDPKVTTKITKAMQHKFWLYNINPITGNYAVGKPFESSYDATATMRDTDEHRFRNSQRY